MTYIKIYRIEYTQDGERKEKLWSHYSSKQAKQDFYSRFRDAKITDIYELDETLQRKYKNK